MYVKYVLRLTTYCLSDSTPYKDNRVLGSYQLPSISVYYINVQNVFKFKDGKVHFCGCIIDSKYS